jgi:hypothetical protein
MRENRDPLDRLLQSAARAHAWHRVPPEPSFALESRVMAAWRAASFADEGAWLVCWLRRATAVACLVVLVSGAWNYREASQATTDVVALTDTALQVASNQ